MFDEVTQEFIDSMEWSPETPDDIKKLVIGNLKGLSIMMETRHKQRPKLYLFIARKDSSEDYCRGHRMASYSSDFEMKNFLTRDELIKLWAEYLQKNMNLDCNESGYAFAVFRDGTKLFDDHVTFDGGERFGYNTDEYYANYERLEVEEADCNVEMTEIYALVREAANKLQGAKLTQEERERAERANADAAAAKENRRLQFLQLQKEFGQ
jgi:hypothetical protein